MQIDPPFGYVSVVPLRKELRLKLPAEGVMPDFAMRTNAIPISFAEFAPVARHYPIIYSAAKSSDEFMAVAVVGLGREENLFIRSHRWAAKHYVPAYVRRFPFCMSRIRVDGAEQDQRLVCVDASAVTDDGERLFDADGAPMEKWVALERFIVDYEADLERCREHCRLLHEYDLLEPFTMNAQLAHGGNSLQLGGMFRIAEQKIESLQAEQLRNLARTGGFGRIYSHLLSIDNFARLLGRKDIPNIS